jgi:hypothetical protein
VAKAKNETRDEVWQRIKKGYFTGELMHLRDIERTLGPGTLEKVAAAGDRAKNLGIERAPNERISNLPDNIF